MPCIRMRVPIVAAAALLAVSNAWARDKPQVAVVGIHEAGLALEAQHLAVAQMVETIDDTGRLQGVDEHGVARAIRGRESIILQEAFLGLGRRLLEDGRILHDQAQPEEAIPILEEAIGNLQLGMASTRNTQDLWLAWTYLGTANLSLEAQEPAVEAFRHAVALNPDRLPNPAQFPPQVVAAYKEVQTGRLALSSKVEIDADTNGVTIFVNGVEVGTAPLTLPRVAPGDVHIVATAAGKQAYQKVTVPERGEIKVEMAMSDATLGTGATTKFARARQTTELYKALGSLAEGVDTLVLCGVTEGRLVVQLYSPRNAAFSKPLEVAFSDDPSDEAVQALKELLSVVTDEGSISTIATAPNAAPLEVANNALLTQMLLSPEPVGSGGGGMRLGLALGIGGAAAVAAGTTVFLLSNQRPDENQGVITIGPVP